MLFDVLALAAPLVLLVLGALFARWDTKRWDARCRAAARPVPVQLFTHGDPRTRPPLDIHAGRAARRARHGATR